MTVFDLMERLGGEIVMNRVRAMIDGKIVIVAILNGTEWEYTAEGQDLYNLHSNLAAEEAKPAKPAKTRKNAAAAVESEEAPATETSEEAPVETPEVEVAPEQSPAAE